MYRKARNEFNYCSGWASNKLCAACERQTAKYDFSDPAIHTFIYRGDKPDPKCKNYILAVK